MKKNLRKFLRIIGSKKPCVVRFGSEEAKGVILDESIGGLRIGNLQLFMLFANQHVSIEIGDEVIGGHCRRVSRNSKGLFELGIDRYDDQYSEEPSSMLLNSFIRFQNANIICVPLQWVDDQRLKIRLMDGKEFVVSRDEVFQITREERLAELQEYDHLAPVKDIYQSMNPFTKLSDAESVIGQEFGFEKPAANLEPHPA